MILLSDTGGTSSDWALIKKDGSTTLFTLNGYNPVCHHSEALTEMVDALRLKMVDKEIQTVYYYGTGIISLEIEEKIQSSIARALSVRYISVMPDLVGAVRATCGTKKGVVGIMGTGSNVCQFDGKKIESLTPSLGYPLGDEGGGVDIGKKMVQAFFYNELPNELVSEMANLLPMDRSDFLQKLKNHRAPNQYLASFAKVAMQHLSSPFIKSLVRSSIRELFQHHISKYEKGQELHFVGSIAYECQAFLKQFADEFGFKIGKFVKSPMEGLIEYHKQELQHVR